MKKFKKPKKRTVILLIVLVVIIALFALMFRSCGKGAEKMAAASKALNESTVERRTIEDVITGKATIIPKDSYNVRALVSGDILAAPFEEGQIVNKGDLLYSIEATSVENSIESAKLSLKRAQLSYDDILKTKNDLNVTSDVSGKIKTITVKKGDTVAAGTPVATIYDDTVMELYIPFNESDAANIHIGDYASVRLTSGTSALSGTVTKINNASEVINGYALVKYITVNVSNPGTVSPSDKATAVIGNVACNDVGSFKYTTEKTVNAKSNGEVSSINVTEGNSISNGTSIITLKSDNLDSQINSAKLALDDAKLSLERAEKQLEDYRITSPITGTVITKSVKQGDVLDNTTANTNLAVIFDMTELKFDMNIDELDVNKLTIGQEVTVNVDAKADKVYHGTVEKISIDGVTQNGVTTYPVKINITDFDAELLPGMNVDAKIISSRAENVLSVPVGAVERGNIVYLSGEKESKDDKAPEGYKTVNVEVGISDKEYVEILSGLNEGDVVRNVSLVNPLTMADMMMGSHGGPDGGEE